MTAFNVFYTLPDGEQGSKLIEAENPETAANAVRRRIPGATIRKVKRVK